MTRAMTLARRTPLRLSAVVLVSLLALAGCGGKDDPKADPKSSESPKASPSAEGGGTVSKENPVKIGIAKVSESAAPSGGCTPAPDAGTTCSYDKSKAYTFDPQSLEEASVVAVTPTEITAGQYALDLTFDEEGTKAVSKLSGGLAAVQGTMGLFLPDRQVLTAAKVATPIDTGHVQVTGNLSKAQVDQIVSLITAATG